MREHYFDQREPQSTLPPRFEVTKENPKPELVFYGIPANIDAIYAIAEEHYRKNGIPFLADPLMFYAAMDLINEACGSADKHITAHLPACSYNDDNDWVVALYNNHNMARRGFPDRVKEDRYVEIIRKMLHQPERPPKLWFWAQEQTSAQPIH